MTGKWDRADVPHDGWTCINIEDLEEPCYVCEMCESMIVRYVHTMEHPKYKSLDVGCVCAGNMELDPQRARDRETDFKRLQARRRRWLTRQWRVSSQGNEFLNTDGFNIVVWAERDHWAARVKHRDSGFTRYSKIPYPTEDAAKLASLNAMLDIRKRRL